MGLLEGKHVVVVVVLVMVMAGLEVAVEKVWMAMEFLVVKKVEVES